MLECLEKCLLNNAYGGIGFWLAKADASFTYVLSEASY